MEKKTYPVNHRTVNVSYETFDKLQELAEKLSNEYTKVKYGALVAYLIEKELKTLKK